MARDERHRAGVAGHSDPEDPVRRIRPYTMTDGRTQPTHEEIELETLIVTTALGDWSMSRLTLERRSIGQLCRHHQSVAEISARLNLPVNVTRILVEEMADDGLVRIIRSGIAPPATDQVLLERILRGLQALG
ncbi:MAG TPA: DUF742 domain-containing protein [Actinomycetes bacterium]|nr:DUF742 domain-containing protein [Actinomycetes bacterium]